MLVEIGMYKVKLIYSEKAQIFGAIFLMVLMLLKEFWCL